MSKPDSGLPGNAHEDWPYVPPEHLPIYADPGDAMPGEADRPRTEWSNDGVLPSDPAAWDSPQELEPPPGWTTAGTYAPGNGDRPPWDDPDQDEPVSDNQYRLNPYETAPDNQYQPSPYQPDPYPTAPYPAVPRRRSRRPARRSLVITALTVAVVAAGAGAALVHNRTVSLSPASGPAASATAGHGAAPGAGHGDAGTAPPGHASAGAQPGAISKADAENVVANYSKVNNKANAAYSDSLLGTIESGSSYTMDAGAYRFALGQSSRAAYVPFQLTGTAYYIPRLPQGSYPRWFAVKGTYATLTDGKNLGPAYLVFAQDSAGAPWKDVIEPDILPGQSLPQIAVDTSGYAQSVAPDGAGLNVAPGKIGQITAEWLDHVASNKSDSVIKDESGNLTDLQDEVFWRSGEGGTAMNATDAHSAPAGQVFALRTTSGGALVFYATAAQLTLTPANGDAIGGLNIPGYYSSANSAGLTSATVGYVEQFATYIPPSGDSDRDVVADISSIASRG
jgi:hypothetical protein